MVSEKIAIGKFTAFLFSGQIFKFVNEAVEDLSILYLESAKAFDNEPYNNLIQNFHDITLGGKLVELSSSYIKNRNHYFKTNNEV